VVVDEPTTGLDPEERIKFRNLLSDMSQKDIIIVLSTHIVGDISSTCKSMALLNEGEVVYNGPPEGLIDVAKEHVFLIHATMSDFETIKERFPVISTIPSEVGWEVQVVADQIDGFKAEKIHPSLEHAYVYFMEYKQESSV
jgi:ABC-type multidrug transport system ATPase subunit